MADEQTKPIELWDEFDVARALKKKYNAQSCDVTKLPNGDFSAVVEYQIYGIPAQLRTTVRCTK